MTLSNSLDPTLHAGAFRVEGNTHHHVLYATGSAKKQERKTFLFRGVMAGSSLNHTRNPKNEKDGTVLSVPSSQPTGKLPIDALWEITQADYFS